MRKIIILLFIIITISSCVGQKGIQEQTKEEETNLTTNTGTQEQTKEEETNLTTNTWTQVKAYEYKEGDVVAHMKTTKGKISILLETKLAPITTMNFIGLASKWYYDGVIFHRIIKWFMIQWGDPDGTWRGWESIYWKKFDDEFNDELKNNKYTISMANAWPNTNGSQFFINTANNNFLDGKHSVFWRVVEWFDIVDNLEKTKTDWNDKPLKEVKMISIDIKEYKDGSLKDYKFDLETSLKKAEEAKKIKEEEKKKADEVRKEANKDRVTKNWDTVSVNYILTLEDGTKKDSSYDRWEPFEFTIWKKMVIKGWDEWLVWHKIGDKFKLEVSPEDGYWLKEMKIPKTELQSFIDAWVKLEKWGVLPTAQWNIDILDSDDDSITIANNNPLAGEKLFFDIELLDIK